MHSNVERKGNAMSMQNALSVEFNLTPDESKFVLALDFAITAMMNTHKTPIDTANVISALLYPFEGNPRKKRDMLAALNYIGDYYLKLIAEEKANAAHTSTKERTEHPAAGDNAARRLTASEADLRVGGNPSRNARPFGRAKAPGTDEGAA